MRAALQAGLTLFLLLFLSVLLPAASSPSSDRQTIDEAPFWIRKSPEHLVQFDYTMTARLHLVFFWAGKDDVGGGYIRRGVSAQDSRQEFSQVLFGSDPEKAPRAINRWGAGTEISWHKNLVGIDPRNDVTASAFFGFMNPRKANPRTKRKRSCKKRRNWDSIRSPGF
jgi:hypothetical protein